MNSTGWLSIALKSIRPIFLPNATRSLFTTSERQWGMAIPRPIPVEPRFSRRFSIFTRIASFFSSRPRSETSSRSASSLVSALRFRLIASLSKKSLKSIGCPSQVHKCHRQCRGTNIIQGAMGGKEVDDSFRSLLPAVSRLRRASAHRRTARLNDIRTAARFWHVQRSSPGAPRGRGPALSRAAGRGERGALPAPVPQFRRGCRRQRVRQRRGFAPRQRAHARLSAFRRRRAPIGVQIFGADPAAMAEAAALVEEVYRPDFLDINFGCPVKKVVKRNGGSGCLRDLDLVDAIIRAVADAIDIPTTVKIRSGWSEETRDPVGIALRCQDAGAQVLTLHARSRTQMYSGRADWREIAAVVEALDIPVIGNGDVWSGEDARRMREETGCAGIMIARGSHGRPWIFREARAALEGRPIPEEPDAA